MRKHIIIYILLLLSINTYSQQAEHVVLITIDGMRPDFYLQPAWNTPNLKALVKQGSHAKGVTSVFPSMTYPAHTTIITGVRPAKHRIFFNAMFEPNGSTGKIYWNDSSIKVPSVWTAAKQKGLKTAALFWPVSADAPVDYNIPDIGSLGETVRMNYSKPEGLFDDLRKNVFKDTSRIVYGRDQNVAAIAAHVIKQGKPNLMTIHFFGVDHYEHEQGRQGNLVEAAIAAADSSVGIVMDALKEAGIWEKTLFIVTGDHGFVDISTAINPNIWLMKEGLITDIKKGEWKAQFFSVGGSSYLYLKDKEDLKTAEQVKAMLNRLPAEEKKYFRIIDREGLKKVDANTEVAFALTGENGASFGNGLTGDVIKPRKPGGAHGFYPDFAQIQTGFVAVGPGVKKAGEIKQMELRDITSIIVKYLNLTLPSAEGKIPNGLMSR